MSFDQIPFMKRLAGCERILIAGAGGGFDVFSGLPLYFRLRELGKEVFLANVSNSRISLLQGQRVSPTALRINAATADIVDGMELTYFPEGYLSQWFRGHGEDVPVVCFEKTGVRPLVESYRTLVSELDLDAIVLVDGGTDILMRGDEAGLGTPQEDLTSVAAVDEIDVPVRLVVCLGFGVDRFHGVCHAHFLENVAALSKKNAYLGVATLLPDFPEVALFAEALEFVHAKMTAHTSIVASSVMSAIEGEYGDVHRTPRTRQSRLWINPLMSMYWGFELSALAERCLYLEDLRATQTLWDVSVLIEAFRHGVTRRDREDIPV